MIMIVTLIYLTYFPINLQWFFVNAYILKFKLKGLLIARSQLMEHKFVFDKVSIVFQINVAELAFDAF